LLWLCFFLSGAAGLALELLWMRSAALAAGSTATTAAMVLAAYFGGLGLGGLYARRTPVRPIRRYAILELCAAAGALWSYATFAAAASPALQPLLAPFGWAGRALVIACAIVPATFYLGATLPTIAAALATPETVGSRGGSLYALNTLGGAIGIVAMGFGMPLLIGVRGSYFATAAVSALAGVIALAIDDGFAPRRAASDVRSAARLRVLAAAAGFLAIGLEVLWIRLFAQVLHNSVYSFAAVSLVFVLAIAAGAAVAARALVRIGADAVASTSFLIAGLAAVAGLWTFVWTTGGLGYFGMQSGLGEYVARIVALAAVAAGPVAMASGAVLPALWAASADRASVTRPIGALTAANLVGCVLGASLVGSLALPALGLRATFLALALGYSVCALLAARGRAALRRLSYVVLVVTAALDPEWAPLIHLGSGETLRASAESGSGIVTVVDTGDDLQLRLDNYYVLGGSAAEQNERRMGLVPLLLHPRPARVAFVGMATGITASAAPLLGVPHTTVIEVVPDVARLAGEYFARWNAGVVGRTDVRLVIDDGRRFLAATNDRFDVIVSDLFIPWHAGAGSLYAAEMYRAAAARLEPGGLFCQWLPLYQLTREDFAVIARTFASAFPHTSVWRNDFYPDRPVVGLIGAAEPPRIDTQQVAARLQPVRDSLLSSPRALGMLSLGELSADSSLLGGASINTDDRPVIEFQAPRLTRMSATGDKDWLAGEAWASFTEALAAQQPASDDDDARRAGRALYRYALSARGRDRAAAARFEDEVRRLVPEVVAAGERDATSPTLAAVARNLGNLRAEQARLQSELATLQERLRQQGEPPP
jgi:spermidine synthase